MVGASIRFLYHERGAWATVLDNSANDILQMLLDPMPRQSSDYSTKTAIQQIQALPDNTGFVLTVNQPASQQPHQQANQAANQKSSQQP